MAGKLTGFTKINDYNSVVFQTGFSATSNIEDVLIHNVRNVSSLRTLFHLKTVP